MCGAVAQQGGLKCEPRWSGGVVLAWGCCHVELCWVQGDAES